MRRTISHPDLCKLSRSYRSQWSEVCSIAWMSGILRKPCWWLQVCNQDQGTIWKSMWRSEWRRSRNWISAGPETTHCSRFGRRQTHFLWRTEPRCRLKISNCSIWLERQRLSARKFAKTTIPSGDVVGLCWNTICSEVLHCPGRHITLDKILLLHGRGTWFNHHSRATVYGHR